MTMDLAGHTEAYQTYLEGHRQDPDNEELYADLLKARTALEISWLHQCTGQPAEPSTPSPGNATNSSTNS